MEIPEYKFRQVVELVSMFKLGSTELEGKFMKKLTEDDFKLILKYLRSVGYKETIETSLDVSVTHKQKQYRVTLNGMDAVTSYCKTNKLPNDVIVLYKSRVDRNNEISFREIGFNMRLRTEKNIYNAEKTEVLSIFPSLDKYFRLKKRFSYSNNEIRFDATLVKSSNGSYKTFVASSTSSAIVTYELEIEVVNKGKNNDEVATHFIKSCVELSKVLAPNIDVIKNYLSLVNLNFKDYKDDFEKGKPLRRHFAGPQPVTLERENILKQELGRISIQEDYTVTEKADGERLLLYVNKDGYCYFINNRMNVIETTVKSGLKSSLLDGERITQDRFGNPINQYAIFDVYWMDGKDTRGLPLVGKLSRLTKCDEFVADTKNAFKRVDLSIFVKDFKYGDNIFEECKTILDKDNENGFIYHIDGLVFTPKFLPVGTSHINDQPKLSQTWNKVFKWKPPQENTIDFLVTIDNDEKIAIGPDENTYQVFNLLVGFKPAQWIPITPRAYLENRLDRSTEYKPHPFLPGDVFDPNFSKFYLPINSPQVITHESIIEFAYENNKWKPLRLREDKTAAYRNAKVSKISGTANDYGTALNIWRTIQYPVTKEHITGEKTISPKDVPDEHNVYYHRSGVREMFVSRPMMDFHNWIKNDMLIGRLGPNVKSLCDLSCGKGGDLNKWVKNGYTKVLGIDISRDNIENPIDGAYARTLKDSNYKKNYQYIYVTLDSSKKITNEYLSSLKNEDDKVVCETIWDVVPHASMMKYRGFATSKFDVVTCMFSLHYFFESEEKLNNFIWNVDKHLAPGGYFIGTCLNGKTVKQKLRHTSNIFGVKNDRKIWNIEKKYVDESNDVQYGEVIAVYMESINKSIDEYLVNFAILESKLKKKGIRRLTEDESNGLGIVDNTSVYGFDYCFDKFENDKTLRGSEYYDRIVGMSKDEKLYSFMNSMFIFRKDKEVEEKDLENEVEKVIEKKKRIYSRKIKTVII